MNVRKRSRLAAALTAMVVTVALVAAALQSAGADPLPPAALPQPAPGTYIVTLTDQPIASYDGSTNGMAATRPKDGRKVRTDTDAAKTYRGFLTRLQDQVAGLVGAKVRQRYSVTLNGFAAELTPLQAQRLQRTKGVVSVVKDSLHTATDDRRSTDYLRLSGESGVWESLGGVKKSGEGTVIGVLDTGIWPESPSFAGKPLEEGEPEGDAQYQPYLDGDEIVMEKSDGSTFRGSCETGEEWTADECNSKLIGARYFADGWTAAVPPANRRDFVSARDGDGHGSHTASTAAGNHDVSASVDGIPFGKISGVAPAAKIAAYKVLWRNSTSAQANGYTSDIVAAIDAAVEDGVDVINYSVGGGSDSPHTDPIPLAFLSAASAGVFVAASAGNSGPAAATMDNTAPWVTTVAANTIQPYEGTVELGDGRKFAGASTTVREPVGPAPLVTGAAVKTGSATPEDAALCGPDSLDPALVSGKIIVCDRGVYDRVAKSAEVKRAGGVGMVLANLAAGSLDADRHTVPTVHLDPPGGPDVKAYAETAGATATLLDGNQTEDKPAYPQIADFSSRGPSPASGGDLVKPDLSAPGVGILAAVAPPSNEGRDFDFLSGTSMAAPHVAGLAALYLTEHPKWAPMRIKSALMTTAGNLKDAAGKAFTDPYAQGAGVVQPAKMFDPALVFDAADDDWLSYLEGLGVDTGTGAEAIDASDYNNPSIGIGELLDHQTVTRKVTALKPGLYRAKINIPGIEAKVTPSILNFDEAGETKTFKIKFKKGSAPFDQTAAGFLTWTGAKTTVRLPVAVTPVQLSAPEQVSGSGRSGSLDYEVVPGIDGAFPIKKFGLASGTGEDGSLKPEEQKQYPVTITDGTKASQLTVRSENDQADLDLYLYKVGATGPVLVAQSAGPTADETVQLLAPEAGEYVAIVEGFANAPETETTPYTFRSALVTPESDDGPFTVNPTKPTAKIQEPIEVTVRWRRLDSNTPYLGFVEYVDGSGTLVTIN
ncbi:S8 family peptidase [Microlunatus speluncae]|uniref:S8 family peptidase n=1 Tax=Microlunatus speluncae TaxID=2594267 RepID=UPI001C2D8799|nr:S8 family peptidase [Microlunatus speluncae]